MLSMLSCNPSARQAAATLPKPSSTLISRPVVLQTSSPLLFTYNALQAVLAHRLENLIGWSLQ